MNADIVPGAAIVTGIEQGIYAEVEKSPIFEMYSGRCQVGLILLLLCRCGFLYVRVV